MQRHPSASLCYLVSPSGVFALGAIGGRLSPQGHVEGLKVHDASHLRESAYMRSIMEHTEEGFSGICNANR